MNKTLEVLKGGGINQFSRTMRDYNISPKDSKTLYNKLDEIGESSGDENSESDWEYYKFDLSNFGMPSEEELAITFLGVNVIFKRLVGDWKTKVWRKTIIGSTYDYIILEGGGDSYTGAIPQVALDLSQCAKLYTASDSIEYTYRELLYADETNPKYEIITFIRNMHPVYQIFSSLEKISKEEWDRKDYTGVILD